MSLITVMSPPGSPGVTTTALALTYAYPIRSVLAECNPEGGALEVGYLRDQAAGVQGGLLELAMSIAHNPNPGVVGQFLEPLDVQADRRVLLGLRDPRHAAQLQGSWDAVAETLITATSGSADVIADIGTLGHPNTPGPLLKRSSLALVVMRPTMRQAALLKPRLEALASWLETEKVPVPVRLCLIGKGEFTGKQILHALNASDPVRKADLQVIAELPDDPKSALLLSDGIRRRRVLGRFSPLMSAAAQLAGAISNSLDVAVGASAEAGVDRSRELSEETV